MTKKTAAAVAAASVAAVEKVPPAEQPAASTGLLLRAERIGGKSLPLGAVLTCPAEMATALTGDGALDVHPEAVAHAIERGAPQFVHEPSEPDAE